MPATLWQYFTSPEQSSPDPGVLPPHTYGVPRQLLAALTITLAALALLVLDPPELLELDPEPVLGLDVLLPLLDVPLLELPLLELPLLELPLLDVVFPEDEPEDVLLFWFPDELDWLEVVLELEELSAAAAAASSCAFLRASSSAFLLASSSAAACAIAA